MDKLGDVPSAEMKSSEVDELGFLVEEPLFKYQSNNVN